MLAPEIIFLRHFDMSKLRPIDGNYIVTKKIMQRRVRSTTETKEQETDVKSEKLVQVAKRLYRNASEDESTECSRASVYTIVTSVSRQAKSE